MRTVMLLLITLAVVAGCGGVPSSDPYASPDTSRKADCERAGGSWHAATAVCEAPALAPKTLRPLKAASGRSVFPPGHARLLVSRRGQPRTHPALDEGHGAKQHDDMTLVVMRVV